MENVYAEQFRQLWEGAFEMYRKETGRDLRNDDRLRKLGSVDDLMENLDRSADNFSEFRRKREKFRHNFMKVLGPVIGITNFIKDLLPGTPGVVASPILAAVSYLVEVGGKVSQAYDYIEGVFSELEEFSSRLEDYMAGGFDKRLEGKITAILTFFIKVIGKSEKLILKGRFRFYLDKAFLGADEATKGMVDELNRLIKTEQQKVVSSTYASVKIIQRDMVANHNALQEGIEAAEEGIRKDIAAAGEDIKGDIANYYKESVSRADEQKLEETLKVPILSRTIELYGEFKRRLVSGTGAWLRKEAAYTAWFAGETSLLFIIGEPGSGKTHLATSIINEVQERFSHNKDGGSGVTGPIPTAFFFIRESDTQLLNVNEMLKALAYQIIESDSLFRRHAIEVCKSSWNTMTAEDTWKNLFQRYYQEIATDASVVIILDGLDEAPKADQQIIANILKPSSADSEPQDRGIQFVVLGRPTIRNSIPSKAENSIIKISRDQNRDDVERYIDTMLSQVVVLEKLKRFNRAAAELETANLRVKISQQSEGVFLWAQLLLDHIKSMDLDGIKNALSNPPKNVTAMINGLLERLAAEEAEDLESFRKMLAWVACSRRPLFFGELLLVMCLPSKLPRLLLWESLNNKFSTMFHLNMPDGFIYRNEEEEESEFSEVGDTDAQQYNPPHVYSDGPSTDLQNADGSFSHDQGDSEISNEGAKPKLKAKGGLPPHKLEGDGDTEDDSDDESSVESTIESSTDDSEEGGITGDIQEDNFSDLLENILGDEDLGFLEWELFGFIESLEEGQLKTEVNFSHQQFRDVLLQNPPDPTSAIKLDLTDCYLMMAISCFDILKLDSWSSHDMRILPVLLDYSLRNLAYHLQKVEIDVLADDKENAVRLIKDIYWIFHEDAGNQIYFQFLYNNNDLWADLWAVWVLSNMYSSAVRNILRLAGKYQESFDSKELEWINQAGSSAKSLFQPWMTSCARFWLERRGHGDPKMFDKGLHYCYFLHALDSMDDEGNIESLEVQAFSYRWGNMGPLTPERIRSLANYAPGPVRDTVHWHSIMAWTLAIADYPADAIPVFQKAVEIDSSAWLAYEGLARAYADMKMYKEAIPVMEEACRAVTGIWDLSQQFYADIAQWKRRLGDNAGALEAAKVAYLGSSFSPPTVFSYLDCLGANGQHDEVLSILQSLSRETDGGYKKSLLLMTWPYLDWDPFDLLEGVFRAIGKEKLGFLIEDVKAALQNVLSSANDWKKRWFCWKTARIVYEYEEAPNLEFVVQNYEMSLDLFGKMFNNTEEEIRDKRHITNFLAMQYYDSAVAAFKSGISPDGYVKKLRDLATSTTTSSGTDAQETFDFYGPGYPSVLWGRWRQIFEQAKKVKWRKCFRPRVLEELNMLDDENPENDTAGVYNLAITLLQAGDDRNASGLLTILFRPLRALRIRPEGQSDTTVPANADNTSRPALTTALTLKLTDCHKCSGDCSDKLGYESLYMCAVCPGRNFCGECIDKVKAGTLARRDCNSNHEWHRAWPSDEKRLKKVADESEDGHLVIKPSWLEEMRGKWR
ncbi:hypothetical protein TWF102_009153 [Orbilia oligospora]|uniref:NACHT domain-containing protein n=1 Tax=Orbilia oligospora TaxID=2813651 RepID=A0A7C8JW13_ORBOL|nr:hypothetical protein TWF103_002962 [Orbilia oligospora]KAF3109887.1 hypothetical protein TWF102_009153 [Orbilia oligospora]KAF3116967.1 hypothetical protein TWF706_000179 [Orbilia oligospora]KAF3145685.1 hypothetical protein TWF703_006827 [Orbilia oligospora]